jgi:hypothetical protein
MREKDFNFKVTNAWGRMTLALRSPMPEGEGL